MNPEEEKKSNNLIIWIFTISILLLILIVYMIFIKSNSSNSIQTANSNITISATANNSYMFASPIRAQADADLIRVTVFVLDNLGNGLKNEKVVLSSNENLDIRLIQEITDDNGKAIFDLSSNTKGQYEVKAEVGGITLNQILKVTFD